MSDPGILMVGNFLSSHGLSRGVCEELAPRLRACGRVVLTTSDRRHPAARLADMLGTIWRRRHEYEVAQVDVYSGPAFRWAEASCALLRRIGKPYVLTLHGGGLPQFAGSQTLRVRRLLNSAQAVTAPSSYLLRQMSAYRQDLILLPNGLTISAYPKLERRHVRPRLVWLRAYHDIYNPRMAVRVVARLRNEFPQIHLTMAGADKGDGSRQAAMEAARESGTEACAAINGPVPKNVVPNLLATGDIFLNTSNVDNTPVSVLEAMASGMCVVSTDVGGIPYLLKSEEDALLVPPKDDDAMARAVGRLLRDPDLAARLRAAAAKKVRQFDWSTILPQWQALLSTAAKRQPAMTAAGVVSGNC